MEQQHGDRVGQPVLLAFLVDAADPVKRCLDRPQNRGEERALAIEHTRHVPAERLGQRDDDGAVQNDLNPANGGHGRYALEFEDLFGRGEPVAAPDQSGTVSFGGQNRSGRSRA